MNSKMNNRNNTEILIAEDSRTQAAQLCFLLERQGYRVIVTADGREALEAAKAQRPALIISDIVMPRMDGYELCKAVKSDEKLKTVPVILVTSLSDPHDVIRGLECGADNFIRKPYDGDYLLSRINYLLMNLELRKNQKMQLGVEIDLNGHKHFITAERQQILDLLISTYEQAVHVNKELIQRDKELVECNEVLCGLYNIADGLIQADSRQAVAETVLERVIKLPGIQGGWIWLLDGESGFRLAAKCNVPAVLGEPPEALGRYCSCQHKLLANELDNAINIIECERFVKTPGEAQNRCHHASIPLWTTGYHAPLGVMNLIGNGCTLFDETVLKILFGIGNQVAVALERARLYEDQARLVEERTVKLEEAVAERVHVQEEQGRLAAIIEATPDLVATSDLDGRVLYYNPSGKRMLGFEQGLDPTTVNLFDTHPGWAARLVRDEGIPYAIEHGTWSGETTMLGADGREMPVLQVIIAHKGLNGAVEYLSTIARDITKRKLEEEAVRQLNETLENKVAVRTADLELARQVAEEASQAKSAFLAMMSHEIRTPMNGVIGMVDVLHQTSLKGYQVEMVELIRESAYSLLCIIDDILDFSKIEAGKLILENAPTPVTEIVEKVCELLDRLAEKKKVDLTLFIDPALPEQVLGDPGRLRQVLVNLVNNAIKFSGDREQAGWVSVRAVLAERSREKVMVEIRIADNGIGMNEQTLSELFTAFKQADASITRHFGGTGLGLAIARHLVLLMDGEIAVQSAPDEGSVFTVRLPFVPLPDGTEAGAADAPVAGLSCLVVGNGHGFADDKNAEGIPLGARGATPPLKGGLWTGAVADDIAVYLAHGGAIVERARDLAAVRERAGAGLPTVLIWVAGAAIELMTLTELRTAARIASEQDVRFVVVMPKLRRKPRLAVTADDVVVVDGNVLTRRTVLKAVAIAAGRMPKEEEDSPLPHEKTEAEFSLPSRAVSLRQGRLILVAEDNETNQKVILRQLALLGLAADVARDGRQALEYWRSGDYALLLTDLHMPKMDGYALTEAIREAEQGGRRIPIVALTANALRGEAEHCSEVGMDDYLSKPVQLAQLQAMLEKWLPPAVDAGAAVAAPVDVNVLKALVGDDPAMIREFLQDFRISATKTATELRAAYDDVQAADAGALAHKLKSSSRSVGALALGELCAEIEKAGKAGQLNKLAVLLPRFEVEMAAVDKYLDTF